MKNFLKGEYKFVVKSPDGTTKETDWIPNLILDQGLDLIGENAGSTFLDGAYGGYMQVGTGTSAPNVSQTSLETPIATETNESYGSYENGGSGESYAGKHTIYAAFAQGAVVGNITEVGIGANGPILFSRALILDQYSNPVSIAVTSMDQLTVYYRLTITPDTATSTGTVTIGTSTYNYESALLRANYACQFYSAQYNFVCISYENDAAIAPITDNDMSGTVLDSYAYAFSVTPYVAGTSELVGTITASPSMWNAAGGIGGLQLYGGLNRYQMTFSPAIPKTNIQTLTLDVKLSWARG